MCIQHAHVHVARFPPAQLLHHVSRVHLPAPLLLNCGLHAPALLGDLRRRYELLWEEVDQPLRAGEGGQPLRTGEFLDEVEHVDTCGKVCRSAQSCLAHVARRGGVRWGRALAAVVVVVLLWREMADDVRQRLRREPRHALLVRAPLHHGSRLAVRRRHRHRRLRLCRRLRCRPLARSRRGRLRYHRLRRHRLRHHRLRLCGLRRAARLWRRHRRHRRCPHRLKRTQERGGFHSQRSRLLRQHSAQQATSGIGPLRAGECGL
mmetsp:Transcript_11549/g.38007  ORF Transcript_11549/g.38007 Transcript_11549/m.38007 type:complete len:262 (-) Transcript_11549:452-1237(-)